MCPDGPKRGFGHNPRHISTLGNLMAGLVTPRADRLSLALEFFRRWGLEDDDSDAIDVQRRLSRAWRNWSYSTRRQFLSAAEVFADAERARSGTRSRAKLLRSQRLVQNVVAAARLACDIREAFPPPWEADRVWIGEMTVSLARYIQGALGALAETDKAFSVRLARAYLGHLTTAIASEGGRMHWQLFADVVWLAGAKSQPVRNESTMRKWAQMRPVPDRGVRTAINQHVALIARASAGEQPPAGFEGELAAYLNGGARKLPR
jgi:hypothetical protein